MIERIEVGEGEHRRTVAVRHRDGSQPATIWFGGFRSDMLSTKADALDRWAGERGRAFVRFDYSGHGESGGEFRDGTISCWLEEGLAVVSAYGGEQPILVGSSMGAWIATLASVRLAAERARSRPRALILIAPAIDFTEALMWERFAPEVRDTIEREGVYFRPSLYSDEPYPITKGLIEDGRRHLLLGSSIEAGCPVHILQGMQDPDVPWDHALRFLEQLPGENVQLTLVKDGDHRLSRPEDLDRLVRAIEDAAGREPVPSVS